jgi:hypothetical protein
MDIETNEDRTNAIALRDRLRLARSRVYSMTVQEASDLEYECRRAGLTPLECWGGNLLRNIEDHYDISADRIDRDVAVYDRVVADAASEAQS